MNTPSTDPSTPAASRVASITFASAAQAPYACGGDMQWKALVWAMILVPALAVGASRVLFQERIVGPSPAVAETNAQVAPVMPSNGAAALEKLQLAVATSVDQVTSPTGHNVGLRWATGTADLSQFQADKTPAPAPVEEVQVARPEIAVTSIMLARGEQIAVVQGKLRRTGDAVLPGWTITQINPDEGTVTLMHTTGVTHAYALSSRTPR